MSKVEETPYEIIKRDSPFKLRSYQPMVVAELAPRSNQSANEAPFRSSMQNLR